MIADKLKRETIVILTDRAGPARDCSTTHKHKWLSAGVGITLYSDFEGLRPSCTEFLFCKFFMNLLAFIFRNSSL
jgi:hypothetical protein